VLVRYWFLLLMPPVILLAIAFPSVGETLRGVPHLTTALVALLLFLSGFCLDLQRLRQSFSRIGAITLSLVSTYTMAPIFAFLIARAFTSSFSDDEAVFFLQGMMLAAAQSSTLATAPTLTRVAGGNAELSLLLTLASSLAMPLLTPAILSLSIGSVVSISYGEMALRIFLVMVLPATCGQILRRIWTRYDGAHDTKIRVVQQLVILLFMFIGIAAAAGRIKETPRLIFLCLLAAALLHLALSLWSFISAKVFGHDGPTRVSLFYAGSQKSVPNGIYLWEVYFAANPIGAVPLVLHQVCQLVSGFLLLPKMEKMAASDRSEPSATS